MKQWIIVTILLISLVLPIQALYSPYYKRCRLNQNSIEPDAIPIENLQIERIPKYFSSFDIPVVIQPELELDYQNFDFFYHEYIDAGGSGQVYMVEDEHSGLGKVVKRFFKERPKEFKRENYIMKKLNYSISWAKDCGDFKCEDNQQQYNTLAIFPHKESIIIRKLQFDGNEAPLIFYKILKQLEHAHKAGIIHNDMKMGNIMVNSVGPTFKFYDVQLIDWNLASFYYTGYESDQKKGTVCYYSPQQLFTTTHITPAIDIWALAIVMFTFYFDSKPFIPNCKTNNIKAILSFIGGQKLLDLYRKYRFDYINEIYLLDQIESHPEKYPPLDWKNMQIKQNKQFLTDDLIEVFSRMLEPDPELRATPEELMNMNYFKSIKRLPKMYSMKKGTKKVKVSEAEHPKPDHK